MILHDWVFNGRTDADTKFLTDPAGTLGSGVLGRRTFDIANEAWGDNPPFGPSTIFVLTHRPHETLQRGMTTFIFVTDGPDSALKQARAAANGKDVGLMGAAISQEYLKAGEVDEIQLHVANVLLGGGRPLFANIGDKQIKLERIDAVPTPTTTHLRYRVIK
jgi:dihydrofolate reductase